VLRYISLRHGGHQIGDANEINGFTFGAVGDKTVIDHLEVFSNYDDGYEWFGGKVNAKYLVAAYNGDDCFDHDEGFRGNYQYVFGMYTDASGDKNGEHDGGTDPECGEPFAHPVTYNATLVGRGSSIACASENSTFHIRDNWSGEYKNSIFTETSCWGVWEIENLDAAYADPDGTCDSEQRLRLGDIIFEYNMWYGHGTTMSDYVNPVPPKSHEHQHVLDYFNGVGDYATGNTTGPSNEFGVNPLLVSLNWTDGPHGLLDPRLQSGSPAVGATMSSVTDPFFDDVNYKGAFPEYDATDPCGNWTAYWTCIYERNIVPLQDPFIPGDANGDGVVNIKDITYLIKYKYKGGDSPLYWEKTGDANNDGTVNIKDITYLIKYKYKGGDEPVGC
jgi:hypothetical protein